MPEPSMEEIIASIGRIIAEDNRTPHPARTSPRERSGVLELTEAIEPDGSVRKLASERPAGPQAVTGPLSSTAEAQAESATPAPETADCAAADKSRDGLLSATAAEAAAAALARLGTAAGEQRAAPGPLLGAAARTLEDIVRDALHPLLQTWLDDHLPDIVERLVHEEIKRLVREARLR